MNTIWNNKAQNWLTVGSTIALCGAVASSAHAADPKIVLSPSMIINESAVGNAKQLVDEQATAGDPANGTGGLPTSVWTVPTGKGNWYYPANAVIDLGAIYNITSISLRDVNDIGNITISKGTPFNWTSVFTQSLDQYNTWRVKPVVGVQTRYLRVTIESANTMTSEIVLNGTYVGPSTPPTTPPTAPPRAAPTIDEFIGTNAFSDDPVDKLAAVGFVREYHNWVWDENTSTTYPNNLKSFNPAAVGGFRFDEFYMNARNRGIQVSPALSGSVASLFGGDASKTYYKPAPVGADTNAPSTYAMHADHMFQFAARYGNVGVADSLLKIAPGQPRTSGAKLLNYYENWNEPDKWWQGREGYFTPYELAAMSSADYDGHLGTLGSTFGVKNADPNAKLAMAGLVGINLDYLKAIKFWADYNRNGSFPADVINVHHYSNDSGGQSSATTTGVSPEADDLKGKAAELVQWRNDNVPGAEVWVSEFGYDVSQNSVQRAPIIGPNSAEEVQGQWLVRSYFALAAAGVDRAQMYMFRDVEDVAGSTTKYNTSGLVTTKGTWAPRNSWYYVSTIKNRLKGMRFYQTVSSGNTNVSVYQFRTPDGTANAYAVWCPTSNNTTVSNYQLSVPSNSTGLKLVTLTNGNATGVETPLTVVNGKVSINVSERPVLVVSGNTVWQPTKVAITSPAEDTRFGTSDSFNVDAVVSNNTNPIVQVDFFRNGTLVSTDTSFPYSLPQSGLPVGAYKYKARSKDSSGALTNSAEITVSVSGGTGLKGQYYNGSNFDQIVKTQTDPTINFDWGYNSAGGPSSINHDAFSVRWTGKIQAIETGTYGFFARYDDGVRVWINDGTTDRLVIDRWTTGSSTYYSYGGGIYLQAGQKYDIKVEYVQRTNGGTSGNGAQVKLQWQRPGQTVTDFIPSAQLYPAP